ncbi:MAG TPA: nucleotidyltransferase family protein [Terriglobales bacterium]|nr:nucleotidyltransferase family protein [Terriglobales bacterium]
MARAPSFVGVILAAGESSRMGHDKALLPWRGNTFLGAAIESLQPHCDLVAVVGGANAESLKPVIYSRGAFLLVNPHPEQGQFSSLHVGVQDVLNRGRDAAIITLVDRPAASPTTVGELRNAFLETCAAGSWAVVPEYEGKHGHPIVVGREMIQRFLDAPATSNAREVEHAAQKMIRYVPVNDANVTANVDTPEEYARLKP